MLFGTWSLNLLTDQNHHKIFWPEIDSGGSSKSHLVVEGPLPNMDHEFPDTVHLSKILTQIHTKD